MGKYKFNTTAERSLLMSKVKGKDTKPEIKLRKALWAEGFRYRIHYKKLPGQPDILIKKYKLVIFVDGEFWHGKDWDKTKTKIKSNRDYWITKIERNISNDKVVDERLHGLGYEVIRFWSKNIEKNIDECIFIVKKAVEKFNV